MSSLGGWNAREETPLDPHFGASLLEGARGGIACYKTVGQAPHQYSNGGFGGGKYLITATFDI
jgi:anaplastic lymphoma kinase